jgi:hypothetical protein
MAEKRRRRGDTRVQGNAFMDTARSAFVRYLALEKWREIDDLRTTLGLDLEQALAEAGGFANRAAYRSLWEARWKAEVLPQASESEPGALFRAIERTVEAALREEESERKSRGDPPLEEDPEYKAFVDRELERLLAEGGAILGTR